MSAERFMVVHFTEPQAEGSVIPQWPQHLTFVPWFVGDLLAAEVELETVVSTFHPFEAKIQAGAQLGQNKDIPVWLVEPADLLSNLHCSLLKIMEYHGKFQEDENYQGANYIPHITPKPHQPELSTGREFIIDTLSIVQKLDKTRVINKHLKLGLSS